MLILTRILMYMKLVPHFGMCKEYLLIIYYNATGLYFNLHWQLTQYNEKSFFLLKTLVIKNK